MSTTFDVFPSIMAIPTFDEVLDLSHIYLKDALTKHNITKDFQIDVRIQKNEGDTITPFLKSSPAKWNDDEYAWFFITGQGGGCDAYYGEIPEEPSEGNSITIEDWCEQILSCKKAQNFEHAIRQCINNAIYWCFRRSAGQPPIVNLSYGLIAAAFAKLTDGFIYSLDSAWEYSLFPSRADEFVQYYFDPNQDNSYGRWAKDCLDYLRDM